MKYKICKFQDANGKEWYQLKSSGYAFGTITKNQLMLIMIMVFGNFGEIDFLQKKMLNKVLYKALPRSIKK